MIGERTAFDAVIAGRPVPRRGFTLLEILVVVAVITLLIAILLPTLSAARRSSKRVTCQSNLRQLATAWQSYLDQFEGHFYQKPNANLLYGGRQGRASQTFGSNPNRPVAKPLNAFLNLPLVAREGAEVYRCPADTGGGSVRPSCFDHYGTSYDTNRVLIGPNQVPIEDADPCKSMWEELNTRITDLRRSQVSVPEAKLLLMGDIGWSLSHSRNDQTRIEWHGIPFTHNLAFLDGHVEYLKIRKGLSVTESYTIIPLEDLQQQTMQCQAEVLP